MNGLRRKMREHFVVDRYDEESDRDDDDDDDDTGFRRKVFSGKGERPGEGGRRRKREKNHPLIDECCNFQTENERERERVCFKEFGLK